MQYSDLYDDFKSLFPEDASFFQNKEKEIGLDSSDGIHVLFGLCVAPYLKSLEQRGEEDKLKRAFSFFEEMANSKDPRIEEVFEFSVLEDLVPESGQGYGSFEKYFGPKTREFAW